MNPYDEFRAQFLDQQQPRVPVTGDPRQNALLRSHVAGQFPGIAPQVHRNQIDQATLEMLARYVIASAFPAVPSSQMTMQTMPALLQLAQQQNYQQRQPPPMQPPSTPRTEERNSSQFYGRQGMTREQIEAAAAQQMNPVGYELTRPRTEERNVSQFYNQGITKPRVAVAPDDAGRAALETARQEEEAKIQNINDLYNQTEMAAEVIRNPYSTDEERAAAQQEYETARAAYLAAVEADPGLTGWALPLATVGLVDIPMEANQQRMGEYAYQYAKTGDRKWFDELIIAAASLGQEGLTAGNIQSFSDWFDDPENKQAIILAYENGYGDPIPVDTDGDGMPDAQAYPSYGGDAVWELYQAQNSAYQRGVSDMFSDPLVLGTLPAAGMAATGRKLASEAAQGAARTGNASLARVLAGEGLQLPERLLQAGDVPVERAIGGLSRTMKKVLGYTDEALRGTDQQVIEDLAQTAQREFDGGQYPTNPAGLGMPPGTAPTSPGIASIPPGPQNMPPGLATGAVPPGLPQGPLSLPPGSRSNAITVNPAGVATVPQPAPSRFVTDQPMVTERYVQPPASGAPEPRAPRGEPAKGVDLDQLGRPISEPEILAPAQPPQAMTKPQQRAAIEAEQITPSTPLLGERRGVDRIASIEEPKLRIENPEGYTRWKTAEERITRDFQRKHDLLNKVQEPQGFFFRKIVRQSMLRFEETVAKFEAFAKNAGYRLGNDAFVVGKKVNFNAEDGPRYALEKIVFGTEGEYREALEFLQRAVSAEKRPGYAGKFPYIGRDPSFIKKELAEAQQLRQRFLQTVDGTLPQGSKPTPPAASVAPSVKPGTPSVTPAAAAPTPGRAAEFYIESTPQGAVAVSANGVTRTQPMPSVGQAIEQANRRGWSNQIRHPLGDAAPGVEAVPTTSVTPTRAVSGGGQYEGRLSKNGVFTLKSRVRDVGTITVKDTGNAYHIQAGGRGISKTPVAVIPKDVFRRVSRERLSLEVSEIIARAEGGSVDSQLMRIAEDYIRAIDNMNIAKGAGPESRLISDLGGDPLGITATSNLQRRVNEDVLGRGDDLLNAPEPHLPDSPASRNANYPDARIEQAAREGRVSGDEARMLAQTVYVQSGKDVETPVTLLDMFLDQFTQGRDYQQATDAIMDRLRAQKLFIVDPETGVERLLTPAKVIPNRGLTGAYAGYTAKRVLSAPTQLFREGVMYNLVSGVAATTRDAISNAFHVAAVVDPHTGMQVMRRMPQVLATGFHDGKVVARQFSDVRDALGLNAIPTQHVEAFNRMALTGGNMPMIQRAARAVTPTATGKRIAQKAVSPFGSQAVRQRRVGVDVMARIVTDRYQLLHYAGNQRLDWLLATRRKLQQWGYDTADIDRYMDEFAHMGNYVDGTPLFTPADVLTGAKKLGLEPGQAEHLSRSWKQATKIAERQAAEDVSRSLFSYKQLKLDSWASKVLVFHYWQSRAIGNVARAAASNPWLLRMGIEAQQYFNETSDLPGLPPWQRGLWRFFGDGGFWQMFTDPINAVVPYAQARELARMDGEERTFDQIMEAVGISPMIATAAATVGWYHPWQAPNLLGTNAPFQAITAIADVSRNYLLPEYLGDETHTGLSDDLNVVQRFFNWLVEEGNDIIGINPTEFNNLGASRTRRTREIVTDLYLEQQGLTYEQLGADDYVELSRIMASEGTDEPDPLMLEALQRESFNLAARRAVNALSPLPVLTSYEPQIERGAMRTGEIPVSETARDNLGDLNQLMTSDTPGFDAQVIGWGRVGDETNRRIYGDYNALVYSSARDLRKRFGEAMFTDADGNWYTIEQLAMADEDTRRKVADDWIAEAAYGDRLEQHRTDRDAYRAENAELAAWLDWRDTYSNLNDEQIVTTRDQMMRANPAYERYVKRLKPQDRTEFGALFSSDAYLVWTGKPTSIYRPADSTAGGDLAASTDLILAGMQDQNQRSLSGANATPAQKATKLQEKINEYEASLSLYTSTVNQKLGADYGSLHPLWQQAAERDPKLAGLDKPSMPGDVRKYYAWRDLVLESDPRADASVKAYIAWLDAQKRDTETVAA